MNKGLSRKEDSTAKANPLGEHYSRNMLLFQMTGCQLVVKALLSSVLVCSPGSEAVHVQMKCSADEPQRFYKAYE